MTTKDSRETTDREATYRDVLAQMANGASEPMLRGLASTWALGEIDRLRDGLQRILALYETWEQVERDDPISALDQMAAVCDEMLGDPEANGA